MWTISAVRAPPLPIYLACLFALANAHAGSPDFSASLLTSLLFAIACHPTARQVCRPRALHVPLIHGRACQGGAGLVKGMLCWGSRVNWCVRDLGWRLALTSRLTCVCDARRCRTGSPMRTSTWGTVSCGARRQTRTQRPSPWALGGGCVHCDTRLCFYAPPLTPPQTLPGHALCLNTCDTTN